jgi:hypothetical protein
MATFVGLEPLSVETGVVLALLLGATAHANKWAGVSRCIRLIDGTRVLHRHDYAASRIRVSPHSVTIDSDEPVVKLIRSVVHECDITDDYPACAVDVDATKSFNCECGKAVSVESRVHPVFLGNVENPFARLNYASRHCERIDILDDTLCVASFWRRG